MRGPDWSARIGAADVSLGFDTGGAGEVCLIIMGRLRRSAVLTKNSHRHTVIVEKKPRLHFTTDVWTLKLTPSLHDVDHELTHAMLV